MGLISIFKRIRDKPLFAKETFNGQGCRCWDKHQKLKKAFEDLGFKTRYRIALFHWSKQRIPQRILKHCKVDEEYHLFIEIYLEGKWIIVDASNDSRLPKYNRWDGKSDCELGIIEEKILNIEKSDILLQKGMNQFGFNEKNTQFYKKFNKFLESLRIKQKIR